MKNLARRTLLLALVVAAGGACAGTQTTDRDDFVAARLLMTDQELAGVPAVALARDAGFVVKAPVCEITAPERFPPEAEPSSTMLVFHGFLAAENGDTLAMVFASDGTSASAVSRTLPVNDHAQAVGLTATDIGADLAGSDAARTAATCAVDIARRGR